MPEPAIVHLHARDPRTAGPDPRPEIFQRFQPRIAAETDAVVSAPANSPRSAR
ncbi:3-keto-5-aminohexanoate cleavage protein [Streptomyces albiaxialis]|uniref:3-keto-5-aminohexanoate cleavage protein n=1 Tax=Streptomyces albiaxialis TaxID=329523 RepID=UPI0031DD24B8